MDEELAEQVYYTLCGELEPYARREGIEDAFTEGSCCDRLSCEILDAANRLRCRLGHEDDDEDVDLILGNQVDIQRELCLKMFYYGAKLAKEEPMV